MKTPTTKAQLERLIKQCGSRRQARIKLDLTAPQFYRLIHRLSLKTDERWVKYGKLAAVAEKLQQEEQPKPRAKRKGTK